MQFIANGPDIPDNLLKAHEEGHVVFFCGTGISCPAGLPSFQDLVAEIYKRLNQRPNNAEIEFLEKKNYDAVLESLESRLIDGHSRVRNAIVYILGKPKTHRKGAKDTHKALLLLSCHKDGSTRLITTNVDHLFEHAKRSIKYKCENLVAPLLPVPKRSRWDGIVYLHGILPDDNSNQTSLNNLVFTSADFGRAYLGHLRKLALSSDL